MGPATQSIGSVSMVRPWDRQAPQAKVDALRQSIDGFCDRPLNVEYRKLILAAVCALGPSDRLRCWGGCETSWCAGPVRAVGMANVLFVKTQTPHGKAPEIWTAFGVSAQTGQAHSKKVLDLLKIGVFDPKWTLPSRLDDSPRAWMLKLDGLIMDINPCRSKSRWKSAGRG